MYNEGEGIEMLYLKWDSFHHIWTSVHVTKKGEVCLSMHLNVLAM